MEYPLSGSGFKKGREIFCRETLCNLMLNWKDQTKYVIESDEMRVRLIAQW